jgi:hypothetical protein
MLVGLFDLSVKSFYNPCCTSKSCILRFHSSKLYS